MRAEHCAGPTVSSVGPHTESLNSNISRCIRIGVARGRLRRAEQAVGRPWELSASLAIDLAVTYLESLMETS